MKKIIVFLSLAILLISCKQNNPKVIIETTLGDITLELYEKEAPVTTKNFIKYIDEKRYAGATFYRVVTQNNQPNSKVKIEVIQGGLYEDNHPQNLAPIPHENTDKTGVFTGAYAVNPVTSEKIPVWVADYVLISYGTGSIMAVPAHDSRDYDFAKKFHIPIKCIISPDPEVATAERIAAVQAGSSCQSV